MNKISAAPIRINTPCGLDTDISAGRGPCQMGWYEWAANQYCFSHDKILDVGAGMCNGLRVMREITHADVYGQDIDERLARQDDNLIIKECKEIKDKSFDVVTCFDVIEHVIEDIEFFHHLKRICRRTLIITTPNFTRSAARNHFHCREYTIPQFLDIFHPDELWSASPDGKVHITQLLVKNDGFYVDKTRQDLEYPIESERLSSISFTHSTVDGNEWAHICGIFKCNY